VTRRRQYITLISSLPPLPRFERAERLPINEDRLATRLRILDAEDRAIIERVADFLAWQRQPVDRTDAEVVTLFRNIGPVASRHPALMLMIEQRMNERTIMAALRRRHRGEAMPAAGEPWGVGAWVHHIENNWDDPDFKLGKILPWVPQARQHLEAGETLALERRLMTLVWDTVDLLSQGDPFGFEVVLAYLFKWDILQRWLSYERQAARERFETLITEVIGEHAQLFTW
jgi:hypothetical protein